MGLFDNLFKNRADGADERTIEGQEKGGGGEDTPDPQAAFLQPKGYAPGATNPAIGGQQQGFVPVLPTARRPARTSSGAIPRPAAASEILLVFGDVAARIPAQFLRPGPHDAKRELRFHLEDLTSDLARGRTGVALSRIAQQCPEFFLHEIGDDDDMEVRLPLQKLVEQVGQIRSRPSGSTPFFAQRPAATAPPKNQPLPPPVAPPIVAEKPAPFVLPTPPRVEPPVFKSAEPIPVAVPPATPPPVLLAPVPEVAESVAEPKVLAAEAVVPEPAAPVAEKPPVAPPPVEEKIEVAKPVEQSLEAKIEPIVEPAVEEPPALPPIASAPPEHVPVAEPPVEVPEATHHAKPDAVAPEFQPPLRVVSDHEIDLSLAAIVVTVPVEMFAAGRPQIGEQQRISLPFAPIERQLGTGSVVVSGQDFWAALPPMLRHHFLQRADLTVPLPLEEIFQNLPVAAKRVPFEPSILPPQIGAEETPVVLAPAAKPVDQTEPLNFEPAPAIHVETPPTPEPVAEVPAAAPLPPEPVLVEDRAPAPINEPPAVEAPAPSAPMLPLAPPILDEVIASADVAAPIHLGGEVASEPEPASALDAAPGPESTAAVQLPPFRIFSPHVEASEAADRIVPTADQPIVLGIADEPKPLPASAHEPPARIPESKSAEEEAPAPGVEPAQSEPVLPSAPRTAEDELPRHATRFSVLPPREIAAHREDASSVVAFNADQPPPLIIESPAAAVAVLHATIAAPELSAVSAGPTISVQPPRMFRPVVLPPPISSHSSAAAMNLSPTLGGSVPATPDSISLAPAPTTPPPQFESPKPVAQPPTNPAREPVTPVVAAPLSPPPKPVVEKTEPKSPPEEKAAAPEPVLPKPPVSIASPAASAMPALSLSAEAQTPAVSESPTPSSPPLQLHIPAVAAAPAPAPSSAVESHVPSLPLTRFDQHSLQSLFMTDETLDIPNVARLAAALPGIEACIVSTRGENFSGGNVPAGFELSALRGLAPQVGAAADRLPIGELKNFTLFGAAYSISFFESGPVCLCVIHRARSFVPGVREKLVAVTEELAR